MHLIALTYSGPFRGKSRMHPASSVAHRLTPLPHCYFSAALFACHLSCLWHRLPLVPPGARDEEPQRPQKCAQPDIIIRRHYSTRAQEYRRAVKMSASGLPVELAMH